MFDRKAYRVAYYIANRERLRAYYAAHREERLAYLKAYRTAHREKRRADAAKAYAANPLRWIERAHKRAERTRGLACTHLACLALGPIQLAWQLNPHKCWMCGVPVFSGRGTNLHMDHVIPLVLGGLHCAENLKPACAPCNRRKHTKVA